MDTGLWYLKLGFCVQARTFSSLTESVDLPVRGNLCQHQIIGKLEFWDSSSNIQSAMQFLVLFMEISLCSLAELNMHDFSSFQLLVGSEDFDIRVFKEDEIVAEMTETEVRSATSELW